MCVSCSTLKVGGCRACMYMYMCPRGMCAPLCVPTIADALLLPCSVQTNGERLMLRRGAWHCIGPVRCHRLFQPVLRLECHVCTAPQPAVEHPGKAPQVNASVCLHSRLQACVLFCVACLSHLSKPFCVCCVYPLCGLVRPCVRSKLVAGEGTVKGLCARMQAHANVWQCAVLATKRGLTPLSHPTPTPTHGVRLTHFLIDPTPRTRTIALLPTPQPLRSFPLRLLSSASLSLCLPLCLPLIHMALTREQHMCTKALLRLHACAGTREHLLSCVPACLGDAAAKVPPVGHCAAPTQQL